MLKSTISKEERCECEAVLSRVNKYRKDF